MNDLLRQLARPAPKDGHPLARVGLRKSLAKAAGSQLNRSYHKHLVSTEKQDARKSAEGRLLTGARGGVFLAMLLKQSPGVGNGKDKGCDAGMGESVGAARVG